jgi:hypothetical protein
MELNFWTVWEKIVHAEKTKKVWFRLFKKIRAFKKNLLGLIIRVKKTKKVWLRLLKKIKCVQKNQEGLVQTFQKNKSVQKKPSWFDNSRKKNQGRFSSDFSKK